MNYFSKKINRGFSLIEMMAYLFILSIIFVSVITAAINLFKSYNRMVAKREIQTNAQSAMNSILNEMKFAQSVYTPTSVFNSANGQLSLATNINAPAGDIPTYTDIYLDNYRVYVKHEGQSPTPLTSEKVEVTGLQFFLYNSADRSQSVSVILTLANNLPANLQQSITIKSGATLRGNNQ